MFARGEEPANQVSGIDFGSGLTVASDLGLPVTGELGACQVRQAPARRANFVTF